MSDTSKHKCMSSADVCIVCLQDWPCDTHLNEKNKNKENTMPQQADDVHELPLHAAAAQQVKQQNVIAELIDGRQVLYGDAVDGMERIAKVWSGILGFEVRPDQVPLMMLSMKSVRASISPDYSDNSDDIEGFLDIFRKVVGDKMIHARTGAEYWAEKNRRER